MNRGSPFGPALAGVALAQAMRVDLSGTLANGNYVILYLADGAYAFSAT